jgi:protein-S-isoprenylcysteine O-methyltransferase Ste14
VSRRRAAIGSALFLLAAPGTAAGLVPWLLTGWEARSWPWPLRAAGGLLLAASVAALLSAFARFAREGIGTPAPAAPTQRLVVGGLYRHVRNPMYVAVVGAVLGQALLLGRPVLLAYALALWAVFAAFVRGYEEPVLRRTYGEDYERFRAAVPAWLPRLRPWRGGSPPEGPAAPN